MDVTDVNMEVHAMEVTDVPESVPETMEHPSLYMPDLRDEEGAMDMSNVPESVPETNHKRRRKECSVTKSIKRKIIECSEDNYYMNNVYYPTWRKYPLNYQ